MLTKAQHKKWRKNGNLKLSYERYLDLSNDLSEDIEMHDWELLELAKFLSLSEVELHSEMQMLKLDVLDFALKFQRPASVRKKHNFTVPRASV